MSEMTAQMKQHEKMTKTPVGPLVVSLGIPTTISMMVSTIYNMADTFFVGRLGTSASGAVGIVFAFMSIIQALGFMYGQGSGSILSRKLGADDVESASRTATLATFAAVVTGIIFVIFGLIFIRPLLLVLGSTETIYPYAKDYVTCILVASPFMMASNVMNNMIRYEGRAIYAMIGLGSGAVLNIVLDPILIFGLNMGVLGAGVATAASQIISCMILVYMVMSGKTQSRIGFAWLTLDGALFFDICATGLASLIRQAMQSISGMILNNCAGIYGGDAAIAAMAIVGRINFFCFAVGLGMCQGFQPVAAYNYGAKLFDRVRRSFLFVWGLAEVCMITMVVIGLAFSSQLIGVFRDDPEVIRIGTMALQIQLCALIVVPFQVSTNMAMQSTGQRAAAAFTALLKNGLYFIPLILVLSRAYGILGVQIAQPIADVLTTLTSIPFGVWFIRKMNRMERETVQ